MRLAASLLALVGTAHAPSVALPFCASAAEAPDDAGTPRSRAADADLLGLLEAGSSPERKQARLALERGLEWLAAAQAGEPDGSLPGTNAREFAPVAVTALGALAYMAGGSAIDRGPHGRQLARAIDYLLACVDLEQGSKEHGYIAAEGDGLSRMHGHGFATLALAEAYSVSPRSDRGARIEVALRAAVTRVEESQGLEGGWYYGPLKSGEHEGSITICLVQGLRAARNAGLRVDGQVIERAVDYVNRLQNADGSFRYSLGIDRSSVALTAAAISTLNATGNYRGSQLDRAYDFVFRELAAREESQLSNARRLALGEGLRYVHYERLYLAQALRQHERSDVFDDWMREEARRLITEQTVSGSWTDTRYGDAYATSIACLVLALPEGLLPIFQR